jgi:hypothetical protein
MIQRRNLRTRGIKMLILDESDEMLNQGFKEQIYDVYVCVCAFRTCAHPCVVRRGGDLPFVQALQFWSCLHSLVGGYWYARFVRSPTRCEMRTYAGTVTSPPIRRSCCYPRHSRPRFSR